MAVAEPSSATLLPIADSRWDQGEIGPSEALLTRGFHSSSNVSHFARVCQASNIISKVQHHRNTRRTSTDKATTLTDALQLHVTLVAFDKHLVEQTDGVSLSSADWSSAVDLALCCSARILLYEMYSCNDPNAGPTPWDRIALETEMQTASLDGLAHVVGQRATRLAQSVLALDEDAVGRVSPFIIECLYASACVCTWYVKETVIPHMHGPLESMKDALKVVGKRWRLARKCLYTFNHVASCKADISLEQYLTLLEST